MTGLWLHYDKEYRKIYESAGKAIITRNFKIKSLNVRDITDIEDIYHLIEENYDFIVLPLSLPRHISVAIAEVKHLTKSHTRLILISGTEVSKTDILRVFDSFFTAPPSPDDFLKAVQAKTIGWLSGSNLEAAISRISYARCFKWGTGEMGIRHPDLYYDYRQSTLFLSPEEKPGIRSMVHRVFVSYSHKDVKWLERLKVHLTPFEREGVVECWADTDIKPGEDWWGEISNSMGIAQVAVLLVSADFLASKFVAIKELPALLKQASKGGTTILPILISPCAFEDVSALSRYQAVNSPNECLVKLNKFKQEAVFARAAKVIIQSIENNVRLHRQERRGRYSF